MKISTILKKGSVKIKVKSEGMLQNHVFPIEEEQTPFGKVPFLISEIPLPNMELLRIAKEIGLPIKCGSLKIFPPGKMPKDLVCLK